MRVHYVYWVCLSVSVCVRERESVCVRVRECVYVCSQTWYSVRLLDFSGGWDEARKLAASFPPTLCNQARRLFVQHAIKQVLRLIGCRRCHLSARYGEIWSSLSVSWIFHSIAHREGKRRGGGKCEEKGGRVWCVCVCEWVWVWVWSREILTTELIRENIENLIRKKWILRRFWNFQRRSSFNGIPCRSKGRCSAIKSNTYRR